MDNQDKQTEKISKGFKIYLNIYSVFLFFSSIIFVADLLSKINFLRGTLYSIVTYGIYLVHTASFVFLLAYGKETLSKDSRQ